MKTHYLRKADIAKRLGLSLKTVDKACSQNPGSLPRFFKLGTGKNAPIRFRLEDVLAFEEAMLAKQDSINAEIENPQATESELAKLLEL